MSQDVDYVLAGGYNGWKNYETWNVALWMQNDEPLYRRALRCRTYEEFAGYFLEGESTPDGVAWDDPNLDRERLDALVRDLSCD